MVVNDGSGGGGGDNELLTTAVAAKKDIKIIKWIFTRPRARTELYNLIRRVARAGMIKSEPSRG